MSDGLRLKRAKWPARRLISIATGIAISFSALTPSPSYAAVAGSGDCASSYTSGGTGSASVRVAEEAGYCYISFHNRGQPDTISTYNWTVPSSVTDASVLVVGGGGGGGSRHAGGGGAGEYVQVDSLALTPGANISIQTGGGGSGADPGSSYQGTQGQTSYFKIGSNGLTALGGGAGDYGPGGNGGSGAGGSGTASGGSAVTSSQTTFSGATLSSISWANAGSAGASDASSTEDFWAGGGGGGAGNAGSRPTQNGVQQSSLTSAATAVGGAGGAGKTPSWLPSSINSALLVGETSGGSIYFAAGGGGGMGADGNAGGPGGLGGGGDGVKYAIPTSVNSGLTSSGSGGGGAGFDDVNPSTLDGGIVGNAPAGNGGSGIVIVRYATPTLDTGATSEIDYYLDLNGTNQAAYGLGGSSKLNLGNSAWTIEAWIKPAAAEAGLERMIINKEDSYELAIYNGTFQYALMPSDTSQTWDYRDTGIKPRLDAWQHVALTKTGNSIEFYFDGQLAYSITDATFAPSTLRSSNLILTVGGRESATPGSVPTSAFFDGGIDEVRIWSERRTDTQILQSMHAKLDGTQANLLAYWDFNEPVGDLVFNRADGVADLSLYNSPSRTDVKNTSTVGADTVITFPRTYLPGAGGWTVPSGVSSARTLVIGGGGGGADGISNAHGGGGGGAGGFRESNLDVVGTMTVTVGAGGIGGRPGSLGGDSIFGSISVPGGGGGGSYYIGPTAGASGGGAGHSNSSTYQAGASSTVSPPTYGFSGGSTSNTGWNQLYAGGGGGAAGSGSAGGTSPTSGRGGIGKASDITGTTTAYSGGGGAGGGEDATSRSLVQDGGGGQGGYYNGSIQNIDGLDGASGFGAGGGGGAGWSDGTNNGYGDGGKGGSGIIIVRFTTPTAPPAVSGFTASQRLIDADSDSDSVTLTWTAVSHSTPVTGYTIEWGTDSNYSNTPINVSGGSTTSKAVSGLNDGADYFFRIKAVNLIGSSASWATAISEPVSNQDYALDFDSTQAQTSQQVIPASAPFTFEAWIKPETQASWRNIVYQGTENTNRFNVYLNGQSFHVARDTGGTYINANVGDITGQWSHIAVTVDADNLVTLYLNGVSIGSATMGSTSNPNPEFALGHVNHGNDGPRDFFDGQIDQVKVWEAALSQPQIVESMHSWGAEGVSSAPTLRAHYDFNDSTQAATISDVSGSHDLVVTGGATSDYKPLVNRPARPGYEVFEFTRSYLTAMGGWTTAQDLTDVEYLAVGGGGSGGTNPQGNNRGGGGGGGGGLLTGSVPSVPAGAHKIVVGQGGPSVKPTANVWVVGSKGLSGQNTYVFDSISSIGGGGGGAANAVNDEEASGLNGGSGGGAGNSANGIPGTGTLGQGSSGGAKAGSSTVGGGGGGGGGALAAGDPALANSGNSGGAGGSGIALSISGTSKFYAGGGGGGAGFEATGGAGGNGGGGNGGTFDTDASDGVAGLGGGGGGARKQYGESGAGGSGVVVLAYQVANAAATNPSNATALTTQTATFSTDASSSAGTAIYQWQVSSDGGDNFSDIAGATSASYTTPPLTSSDNNKQFRVVVTASLNGTTDTTTTTAATLTVNDVVSSSRILHYNASNINSFDPTDSPTAVKDLSGNGRHASIVTNSGNPVSREGQSFKFDGSQSYIKAPELPSSIDFSAGITIDFIADFESADTWERIIDFGNGSEAENIIIARPGTEGNNIRFEIYDAVNSNNEAMDYVSFEFTNALLSGLHRYTIKASHSEVVLYRVDQNGTATEFAGTQRSGSGFGVPKSARRTSNFIGKSNFVADAIFDGAIRQISLYNRALSPSQVATTYQTVTFDSNGGTDPDDLVTSGTIRLPSPGSKSNYSFDGWFEDESYTTLVGDIGDPYTPGDLELHAKWSLDLQSATVSLDYGTPTYAPSGTISPTLNAGGHDGTPTYSSTTVSICSVNSSTGEVTIVQAGDCTITVSIPETSNYLAASDTDTFTIAKANQTALIWDQSKISYDYLGSLDLSSAISGGNVSILNNVTFLASGSCVANGAIISGGSVVSSCNVTATLAGDVNYNPISLTQSITINKINQSPLAIANPGTVTFGETIQLSSTGGSGTGAVSFSSNSASICTETSNDGEFEFIGVGDCVVTVTKAADTNYHVQTGTRTITSVKATHSLSFTSTIPANPVVNGTYPVTGVSSTGEASLAPSFTIAAASSSICSIAGDVVTFDLDGVCEIEANKAATANYEAAQTVTQRIVVGQANQSITFAAPSDKTFGDSAFSISGTSTSGNPVTFTTGSGTTNSSCSVTSSGLVVIAAVGTCEIVANSASGNGYAAASPVARTFEVTPDTAGAPFITAVSFGDQSLTATYFAPSYVGGGTISGYQLQAFDGNTLVATQSSCAITGTLSCTVTGLTNGTSYTLKIAAITEAGLGALSPASSAMIPASNPEAVSNLTAVQGDSKLTITWRAPSNLGGGTLDSFRIYHREAGGSYPGSPLTLFAADVAAATTNGVTTFEITGLTNGQAYDVKVITVTDVNLSNLTSATTEVTQTPYTVPDAPLTVEVLEIGDDIVITWSQPVFDGGSAISGYSVLLDSVAATCTATSSTSCTIPKSSLTPGTTVTIDVKAENDAGLSTPASTTFEVASIVVITPDSPAPTQEGPAAEIEAVSGQSWAWTKRISKNEVKVYIKFPEMGANYQISLQKNDGDFRRVMSKTINTTADTDLRVVGEWYYLVRTITLPGEGRYRIEITQDGQRMTLNGEDRPAVYSYR